MRTTRKNLYEINYWPGFVDVLGTLLIVTIFTVLISTITQIYFNDQLEVKRGEISNLDEEIDNLVKLILTGSISILLIQTYIHFGVNIRILPTTGMTLPFISYGGSSMISSAILFGFILSLTKKNK